MSEQKVNDLALVLMKEWVKQEPGHPINAPKGSAYPVRISYVATFVDMARAAIEYVG